MERKRARLDWLWDGDRNIALFQAKSRARAKRNKIKVLKRADGSIATKQEDLERVAMDRPGPVNLWAWSLARKMGPSFTTTRKNDAGREDAAMKRPRERPRRK